MYTVIYKNKKFIISFFDSRPWYKKIGLERVIFSVDGSFSMFFPWTLLRIREIKTPNSNVIMCSDKILNIQALSEYCDDLALTDGFCYLFIDDAGFKIGFDYLKYSNYQIPWSGLRFHNADDLNGFLKNEKMEKLISECYKNFFKN